MPELKRRVQNIIIGFDQFCQVLFYLGNYTPDETISGVIGRKIKAEKANKVEKVICKFLNLFQKDHCVNAIDTQEDVKGEEI